MRNAHDQPWVTYLCPFCAAVVETEGSVIGAHQTNGADCIGNDRLIVFRIRPRNVPVTVEAELHPSRKYRREHFGGKRTVLEIQHNEYPTQGGDSLRAVSGGSPTLGRRR